jgi:diadenosine tetraphosphate (Ap4A) HIT family hydrolase
MGEPDCPFCGNREARLASNRYAFAILDRGPLAPGHSLVISRRHVPTVFDLRFAENRACFELVRKLRERLEKEKEAKSFPIVVNCGSEANQTVCHAHIHLVPRYSGMPLSRATVDWSSIR